MNFAMITLNENIKRAPYYVTWILKDLLFKLKPKIFMKTLLMTLKNGRTHQTTAKMIIDRFQ